VNTSAEASKNGVEPGAELLALVDAVRSSCKKLKLCGLMTIGSPEAPPERDFERLVMCRAQVAEHLKCKAEELELSMGMSHDFERAIAMGATNVRVGSSIFGARAPKTTASPSSTPTTS